MAMPSSLPEQVKRIVQEQPSSIAVISADCKLDYQTFWKQVERCAGFLQGLGLRKGDRVALLIENSIAYPVAYYAVLVAGCTAVAMNTAAKSRDLCNWIRHCDAALMICDAVHPELSSMSQSMGERLPVILIGNNDQVSWRHAYSWEEACRSSHAITDFRRIQTTGLAAIIYTSGTTGQPKGVMLSHHNLIANIQSILAYLQLTSHDSIVNVLPFYYSYGNSILHTHLCAGARLIIEGSMLYPVRILRRMEAESVTGFSGVPSTYSILLNRVDLSQYKLDSLRYVTQAGGPMAPADIARFRAHIPHAKFYVMYGQTEASARLTYLPPARLDEKMGSIGIPIPGVTIEVRDESGSIVPVGETGEICATGENIMCGYWNDPETSQKVVKEGWLYTGDLARYDQDGYLYIVGRAGEMIKSGAHRISPKDVEEVVLELEGVAEVAAIGVPDEVLGQAIKIVVVRKPGSDIDSRTIQRHCRQQLAAYKIPKIVEFAADLPRTASGKIQRYKLQDIG